MFFPREGKKYKIIFIELFSILFTHFIYLYGKRRQCKIDFVENKVFQKKDQNNLMMEKIGTATERSPMFKA